MPQKIICLATVSLLVAISVSTSEAQTETSEITPASHEVNHENNPDPGQVNGLAEQSIDWLSKRISPPVENQTNDSFSLFANDPSKSSIVKTGAKLVFVASLLLLIVFLLRLRKPNRQQRMPGDVVAVLGQKQIGPAQRLQLIRLGSKILLVSNTQTGTQTLGEISDPEEVYRIESMCQQGKWPSFSQAVKEKAERQAQQRQSDQTILGSGNSPDKRPSRTLLEA